jgi:hypothetical protein
VNVSTDLALCFYATNEADRALKQIDVLARDRSETRQDAAQPGDHPGVRQERSERRRRVVAEGRRHRPDSAEARIAKKGLDGIESRHSTRRQSRRKGGGAGREECARDLVHSALSSCCSCGGLAAAVSAAAAGARGPARGRGDAR